MKSSGLVSQCGGGTPSRPPGLGTLGRDKREPNMNALKVFAIVLLLAGTLSLVYGGFSYTKDTTALKLGPIELSVKEKQQVNIPLWAGIGAIVVGGLMLVSTGRRG